MASKTMRSTQARAICRPGIAFAGILTGALLSSLGSAAGQSSDPLYAGKQIRMVIAGGAGGAYDAYARILAMHLPRHIPGNPSIIDQNMPTAAGMQATNW